MINLLQSDIHFPAFTASAGSANGRVGSQHLLSDYLTKEFNKARGAAHAYDQVPAGERPAYHEIRALGARLCEQQRFPMDYIQALMGHADEKMTKHYQEGHGDTTIESVEVGAGLAF